MGRSRSGRAGKKSAKLTDFEFPNETETRIRRQTPVKTYSKRKHEDAMEFQESTPQSLESDSSGSEYGSTRSLPNSLYMMEKSKKKLIVTDGNVVGTVVAKRKYKGKTRIPAYMMWAKGARIDLVRKHPDLDFSAISKRLGKLWANISHNERYLWKRKAKLFAMQNDQNQAGVSTNISNPSIKSTPRQGPERPSSNKTLMPNSSSSAEDVSKLFRITGCRVGVLEAHLRLLSESLVNIGKKLDEFKGPIEGPGLVSMLVDTLIRSLDLLLLVTRVLPALRTTSCKHSPQ